MLALRTLGPYARFLTRKHQRLFRLLHSLDRSYMWQPVRGAGVFVWQEDTGAAPQWYLRMYKNVGQQDLEMLVPGGMIGLLWYDWLLICGPIAFSFCYAIYIVRPPIDAPHGRWPVIACRANVECQRPSWLWTIVFTARAHIGMHENIVPTLSL